MRLHFVNLFCVISFHFLTPRRTAGKVTPVKNQEQCGSCWAFSATETIESAYMLKHGLTNVTMQPLGPQQMYGLERVKGSFFFVLFV
jgi:aminopeptidase C